MPLQSSDIQRIAGFELNALRVAGTLGEEFEQISVPSAGTPVFDINGTLLYHRLPLTRGRDNVAYADIAVNEVFGQPLLAVSTGLTWNERDIIREAERAAKKIQRGLKYNTIRFVAYSYPKVGVQFLREGQEALLLELGTWAEVPPANPENRSQPPTIGGQPLPPGPFPSNFERWSVLDETPEAI